MWTKWSDCSHTCGGGIQLRERECVAPKYMKDMFCDNDKKESRLCRSEPCPSKSYLVAGMISSLLYFLMMTQIFHKKTCFLFISVNGKFGQWSPWSPCSVTCGIGVKNRTRTCHAPEPQFGGKSCTEQALGSSMESTQCYLTPCPGTLLLSKMIYAITKQKRNARVLNLESRRIIFSSRPFDFVSSNFRVSFA